MYSYRNSLKSDKSDELINTYLLRPIAGIIVWVLYDTPITPNQVTIVSILSGMSAALFYLKGTASAFIVAGLLVTLKDILDSADGQLARAKHQQSRTGRFLDSIGDFVVDAVVFGSIGWTLCKLNDDWLMVFLALLGLIGISLRVSFHVFYQVHFLHLQKQYLNNRITEEVQEKDLNKGGFELTLQQIFQIIYGWQDKLVARIDGWSAKEAFRRIPANEHREPSEGYSIWYSDTIALRISGLLGFGTELFLLMVFSVLNQLELYLYLNMFLMNGILIICIMYRRFILSTRCCSEKKL
ncbi:MAG: CDP-alcohol phosphatidyltransferase family protein [Ignavibacteriales bacterium]|nr:CDP-alcohol phosphatidyltransferase family protein [Ignavibacteriales bacterium]